MLLQPRSTPFLFPDAITRFARGLAYARTGDVASAKNEELILVQLRDGLAVQKNTYWSNQVDVQRLAVDGWIALAQGAQIDALSSMRAAADLEDSMEKHIVTPGPIVPARELLAKCCSKSAANRGAEGIRSFIPAPTQPLSRRIRAAQAAALAGDHDKAMKYYAKVIALAQDGDRARPEISVAMAYLHGLAKIFLKHRRSEFRAAYLRIPFASAPPRRVAAQRVGRGRGIPVDRRRSAETGSPPGCSVNRAPAPRRPDWQGAVQAKCSKCPPVA